MNGIMQDFRYALRQLFKSPAFALTAVVTLALGIGANTAIFTVFNQVLLRPLPVQQPNKLVQLSFTGSDSGHLNIFGGTPRMFLSWPMYRDLRDKNTVFSGMMAETEVSVGAVWNNKPELLDAELVSGNYFNVLGVGPALGRVFVTSDDALKDGNPVVVLSYDYWKSHLAAEPGVIGKALLVNGHPFTIVGVAPQGFQSAIGGFKPKLYMPASMKAEVEPGVNDLEDRRSKWITVVARLKPGISMATAKAAMQPLWKGLRAEELKAIPKTTPQFNDRFVNKSELLLTEDSKGMSPLRDAMQTPLLILMGMVLLLAAMTCVNLTSLLLVRAAARGREFAVRSALGAGRGRILRQLLMEGLLLGTLGGALGLALAPTVALVLAHRIAGNDVPFSVAPSALVLWFNILLSLGVSVLFSMAPALQIMRSGLNEGLRQQSASTLGGAQRTRKIAIALQIGLSVLLLSGAGLFLRTLHNLKSQDLGITPDHLLNFAIDPTLAGYAEKDALAAQDRIRAVLAALPGVRAVAGTTDPVLSGNTSGSTIAIQGYVPQPDENLHIEAPYVTPGYFATLGIPMLVGRDLSEADVAGAPQVVIVSKSFAEKYFKSPQNALGHYISNAHDDVLDTRIVGVVGDAKHSGVRDEMVPMIYHSFAQNKSPTGLQFYLRTSQDPKLAENSVRVAMQGLDSKLVIDSMKTMDEQIDDSISNERLIALLAVSFALVALLTTAVGLYGVLAFATAQRTKEIGIRMALGAQRSSVVSLVLMDMVRIAAIGIGVALPLSVAMSRLMRSQMFEISAFDPLTLVGCVLVTAAMVMMAAALPARRAASVEPSQALRTE